MKRAWKLGAGLVCAAALLWGMTVNGSLSVLGTLTAVIVDFSGSSATAPARKGAGAPGGTCVAGEQYFRTDGTAGMNLYFCTAANVWTQMNSATALNFRDNLAGTNTVDWNPLDSSVFWLVEDFAGGANTTGNVGNSGMVFTGLSSGTLDYTLNLGSNGLTAHPGVAQVKSTTSTNSGGVLSFGVSTGVSTFNADDLFNSKDWEYQVIARLPSTSDARFRVALQKDLVLVSASATAMIRYDTNATYSDQTKNGGTGAWVAQVCPSGGCGSDTGGVTAAITSSAVDTNWHRFRLAKTGTTMYFQVDNGAAKTMCASGCDMTTPSLGTLSSVDLTPSISYGISGTTQRSLWVDWAAVKMRGLQRY